MSTTDYKERYRPQFHFTPATQWMNDPNGLVFFEGEYHLFYQFHPDGTTWGPMHWGHAVSTDLVNWEHLPIALFPDQHGYIFSGSAVVDWNDTTGFFSGIPGLVAIFTHAGTYPDSDRPRQRQSLAYSTDKGRTWTMYEGNPVLSDEHIVDFRDPKVFWHENSTRWVMSIAAGDRIRFYTSENLKEWSFASEFGAKEGSHDGVWECPDLIELPIKGESNRTKWVLIVSIGDHADMPEGSRTQYFIGDFDGTTFTNNSSPDTILWLDHGRDNYAGVTWSDSNALGKEKLFIGWMSNWKYANITPTDGWRSAMTIPRVLTLRGEPEGLCLIQTPIPAMRTLRNQLHRLEHVAIQPTHNQLVDLQAELYEIELEIERGSATEFGLKIRTSEREETIIGYDAVNNALFIDRSNSGDTSFHTQFACKHSAPLMLNNEKIKLHIFVDQSSVEVFANDGKLVLTDQIFPDPSSTGLELYAISGEAILISMSLYTLESMYTINRSRVRNRS
ncbi:glycoside hydrolase family 32 protein [Paenibacillus sp. FSL H7-0331]|uniref:glycoside hydrolase family 32 protein n=2 Tax=Paenibacillus sp. FSL H7-0331 TaxID=1920421 RepID=UPI0030F77AC0